MALNFEWDDNKNRINIAKHGVSFELARRIFEGFTIDAVDDRFDYGEARMRSIGRVEEIAVIVVVHTDRYGICRIISARQANRQERARYDETIRDSSHT